MKFIEKILKEGLFTTKVDGMRSLPPVDDYENEKIKITNSLNKKYPGQFSNAGLDEENNVIANCNFCNSNGVLVREHIGQCKLKEGVDSIATYSNYNDTPRYKAGYNAGKKGKPKETNPYSRIERLWYDEWKKGWWYGNRERENRKNKTM